MVSCRIKPLERLLNCFVDCLDLCRIGRNQVERRSDRNGERLIQALIQAIGIVSRFLQERSRRFWVLEAVAPLFTDVADECIERHVHDFLGRKEIRQDRSRRLAELIRKELLLAVEQRELAELQKDVRKHVRLFLGQGLGQVQTMPCQSLQSKELVSTPRLVRDSADACEIRKDEGVNEIVLAEVDEGLLVIRDGLGIQATRRSAEGGEPLMGG